MEIKFKSGAIEDINYWKHSGNSKIQNRISELLHSIILTPENGIGKPERLKGRSIRFGRPVGSNGNNPHYNNWLKVIIIYLSKIINTVQQGIEDWWSQLCILR
jgi:hypothetical protein